MHKFNHFIPNDYNTSEQRIDIWQYALHEEHRDAYSLLNQEEKDRANRYHFERHRRRFIMARATLRQIIARYLQVDPKAIELTENAYGKPALVQNASFQFNLSHSGELALLAIGQTHPVGIDLECFSARPYTGIAKEMFSSTENLALKSTPEALKTLTFFHLWAQKEAFIKACGMGLSYPTKQFDVPALLPAEALVWDDLHQTTWKMISFMPQALCCAALCHHPDVRDIRYNNILTELSLV